MFRMITILLLFVSIVLASSHYTCSDCTTSAVMSRGRKVASVRCSGLNSFCRLSTGTCSPHPDHHCGEKDDEFICTEDGFFPDVDCSIYHVCKDNRSTKFRCDGCYNADKRHCEKNGIRGNFNCSLSTEMTPHSLYPQYYAKCNSGDRPPLIYKCSDSHRWNPETKICEAICLDEGLIPDENDCGKYFRCTMDFSAKGKTYKKFQENCPEGQTFDTENGICMPSESPTSCSSRKKRSLSSSSDLFCLEDGLYPAQNCHEYYSCENFLPILRQCSDPSDVFNPQTGACQKGIACGQYNCEKLGRKAPHTVFPTYYTYCGPDVQPLALGRCQGKLEMDYTAQNCINVCRSGGLKPDPSDCSKYYRCRWYRITEAYGFYSSESHTCPNGLSFDPIRLNCSKNNVCNNTNV